MSVSKRARPVKSSRKAEPRRSCIARRSTTKTASITTTITTSKRSATDAAEDTHGSRDTTRCVRDADLTGCRNLRHSRMTKTEKAERERQIHIWKTEGGHLSWHRGATIEGIPVHSPDWIDDLKADAGYVAESNAEGPRNRPEAPAA